MFDAITSFRLPQPVPAPVPKLKIDDQIDTHLALIASHVNYVKRRIKEGANCNQLMSEAFVFTSLAATLRDIIACKADGKTEY